MVNEHVSITKSYVTSQNCARNVVVTRSSTFVEKKNPAQEWESQPRLVTWHRTPPYFHKSHLILTLIGVHTLIPIRLAPSLNLIQVTKLYLSGQTSDHVYMRCGYNGASLSNSSK